MRTSQVTTIDQYIAEFPEEIQSILEQIRTTIKKTAPAAKEAMKYGMPTFVYEGNLVHFAAFKNHFGFYPAPSGIEAFDKQTSQYKAGKGTLQFPIDQPIPYDLIVQIVQYRLQENEAKAALKKKK